MADASIRLAVEGGSSFKQAMQAAESSVKLFNTELKNLAQGMASASGSDAAIQNKVKLLGGASEAAKQKVALLTAEQQKQIQKLNELKKALDDANKEQGENSAETEKAANAVNKQTKVVNDLGVKLSNAQAQADKFEQEMKDLANNADSAEKEMNELGRSAQTAGNDLEGAGNKAIGFKDLLGANIFGGLITQGIQMAVNEIRQFVQAIIDVGSEYEAQMAKVSAISGAYKDSTGQTMRDLEQLTKDLSGYFTATEIGSAMEFEAMAGWDVDEIKEATQAILNLAQAGGVDLARASELMTTGLNAFGLSAEDSYHYADVLAMTAASAATSVDDMGDTFTKVAPIAGTLGFSVEDVSLAVGLLANNGLKGARAGTSLQKIMQSLANPTQEVQKIFDDLGITLRDEEGNFLSFEQMLGNIRNGFEGLPSDKVLEYSTAIAGVGNASTAFASIINATDDDFNDLRDAINGSTGAAQEMADVMGDTYEGATRRAKSATENLQKSIFDLFKGPLTAAQEGFAKFANSLADAIENGSPLIGIIAGIAAGLAAMGIASAIQSMGGLVAMVKSLSTAFQGLNSSLGIIGLIAAAVVALITLYNTNEEFRAVVDKVWGYVLDVIGGVVNALVTFFTETIPNAIQRTIDFFTQDIPNAINTVVTFFSELPGRILQFLLDGLLYVANWYIDMTTKARETAIDFVINIGQGLADLAVTIWNALKAGIMAVANFVIELNNSANEASRQFSETLINGFKALPGKMAEIGKNIIEGLGRGILSAFGKLRDKIVGIVNQIKNLFTGAQGFDTHSPSRWSEEIGGYIMVGLANGIVNETGAILPVIRSTAQRVGDALQSEIEKANNEVSEYAKAIENETAEAELKAYQKNVAEKYAELEKAEVSSRQRILDEIEKLETDWNKKQLDAERKAEQASLKERAKFWEDLKKDFDKQIQDIEKKEESLANKIAGYGDLFTKVQTEAGEMLKINNLDEDIRKIEEYGDALNKLQDKGVSKEFLSEITSLNIDDATAYMDELLKMTDKDFDTYMDKWQEKQDLSKEIAKEFYSDEMEEVSREMLNTMQDFKNEFDATGEYLMQGVAQGILDGKSEVINAAVQAVQEAQAAANAAMGINSPSTEMAKTGKYMAQGLGVGWLEEMRNVNRDIRDGLASTADMVTGSGIMQATEAAVNGINAGQLMSNGNGQPVYISLILDGKQIAQAVYDPLKQVRKQRGR